MPNLNTPFLKENATVEDIREWATTLIKDLRYVLNNLDAGNVTKSAQVESMEADKLTAGMISGVEMKIGDNFSVDYEGNMNAKNGTFQGDIVLIDEDGTVKAFITGDVIFAPKVIVYDENGIESTFIDGNTVISGNFLGGRYANTENTAYLLIGKSGANWGDLRLCRSNGKIVFQVSDDIGGISLKSNLTEFLWSSGGNTSASGQWNFWNLPEYQGLPLAYGQNGQAISFRINENRLAVYLDGDYVGAVDLGYV